MQTQCLAETAVVATAPLLLLKPAAAVHGVPPRLMTVAAARIRSARAIAVEPVVHAQPENAAIDVYAKAPQRMTLRGFLLSLKNDTPWFYQG